MNTVPTQRAGVFAEVTDLLAEHGLRVPEIFDGSGIDPGTLTPDTRLPFDVLLKFLHHVSQETRCPHLGLLLGLRFKLAHHGAIGQLMQSAPTLHRALLDFVTWQPGYSSGAIVYLNRLGDEFAFGYGCYTDTSPGTVVLYDAIIGVAIQMLSQLTKGVAKPTEIHFSRRRPDDTMEYAKLLRLPIRFDQPRTCLFLDANTLKTPLPGADPRKRRVLLEEIRRNVLKTPLDTSTRTRHALRQVLHTGKPTLSEVSSELAMHPRTLERRLADEGHTFGKLRDEVRFLVACELLDLTDIPVGDIATSLAFASHGVFTTSFHRISGEAPSAWRARASRKQRSTSK